MALKSIIDVEVNDDAFTKFAAKFREYQAALEKTPAAWADIGKEAKGQALTFDKLVVALVAQTELLGRAGKVTHATGESVKSQAHHWHDMARDTKAFASHITSATKEFLKWTGVIGAFSGLLGAGGLFGIERLAQSAGGMRRSAAGLDLTPGEQRAFSLNFGRVVDPTQLLGGVNEAMHDATKRWTLTGAGLTDQEIRGKDTGQVAAALLPHLKSLADKTPDAMMAQVLQSRGLSQFITLQDFERLKRMSPAELAQYEKSYQKDRSSLGFSPGTLKAWQDFQVQLTRAGNQIETTFIKGLSPLAPELSKLSDGFSDVVKAFLGSEDVKHWIDLAATGLHEFAGFLHTPKFQKDVRSFIRGVGELATALGAAAKWIAGFIPETPTGPKDAKTGLPSGWKHNADGTWTAPADSPEGGQPGWGVRRRPDGSFGWVWIPNGVDKNPGAAAPPGTSAPPSATPPGAPASGIKHSSFRTLEQKNGLPGGILDAVYQQESSRGRNLVSPAGALGPFQFMPGTARQYGVADPFDLRQASGGASRYLRDLLKEFGGDTAKALAAYNWGPGNVERDVRAYGRAWREHLPAETRNYLNSILPRLGATPGRTPATINIQVHNNTGGSATVAQSQLAA